MPPFLSEFLPLLAAAAQETKPRNLLPIGRSSSYFEKIAV